MSRINRIDAFLLAPRIQYDRIVPERLKEMRLLAGITQAELADRIGEKPSNVRNWEEGRSSPRDNILIDEMARALSASPSYLSGETDNPNAGDKY
jgi:transcriptional regulator with XRE-family HTH domain